MAGLFALFGCVTWLNGVLIPFLKVVCQLDTFEALLVTFAFYIAYFVMALPSARVLNATGYRRGMALGLAVMAAGTAGIPAGSAAALIWPVPRRPLHAGHRALPVADGSQSLRHHPRSAGERGAPRLDHGRMQQARGGPQSDGAWGTGIRGFRSHRPRGHGPVSAAALATLAGRLITPYVGMAVGLLVLAIGVERSGLPEPQEPPIEPGTGAGAKFRWSQHPLLLFGFWALFFEMAVEVIAGDTIVLYGQALHVPIQTARFFASFTLGAMVLGYVCGIILIPKRLSQQRALALSAALGMVLTVAITLTHGMVSVLFVASLGFANAVLWPAIFPIALTGLGEHTKTGAAIMIMAIIGGAVVPPCYGLLARVIGNQMAYLALVPMYAVMVAYALYALRRAHSAHALVGASS